MPRAEDDPVIKVLGKPASEVSSAVQTRRQYLELLAETERGSNLLLKPKNRGVRVGKLSRGFP